MTEQPSRSAERRFRRADLLLFEGDRAVYLLVALLFLLAALAMALYTAANLVLNAHDDFPRRLVEFVDGLLLVLIIMEVLGTVRSYLSTGHTSLRPFLYIGIISATRRILAIGAETTLGHASSEALFRRQSIDLGVNAAVVLALAAALFLLGRQAAGRGAEETAEEREG
jgi:phosphate starvation-inducible membrane PsiE